MNDDAREGRRVAPELLASGARVKAARLATKRIIQKLEELRKELAEVERGEMRKQLLQRHKRIAAELKRENKRYQQEHAAYMALLGEEATRDRAEPPDGRGEPGAQN